MGETFDLQRDRQRRLRVIWESVRAQHRGEPAAVIAAELTRRFQAAGLPQLPEAIDQHVAGAISRPQAVLAATVMGVRALVRREVPSGLRAKRRELAGGTWTAVRVADEPLTRRALRIHHDLSARAGVDPLGGYAARLVALPTGDVAVFLGNTYAGLLPPETADVLHPAALATDAADQRLMVRARITPDGDSLAMAVAVP
jgi:hypothetical protein